MSAQKEPTEVNDSGVVRADDKNAVELERIRNDFELKKLEIALSERRLNIEERGMAGKGSSELKTGLISIASAIVAALGTYAAAYYGGFFDVQKANIASTAPLNLTKLQFSNELVKTALSSKNPANSLMFYADVGLLEGLKSDSVKDYAAKENKRIQSGVQGPSLLPSLSSIPTFPTAPTSETKLRLSNQLILGMAPNAPQGVVVALTTIGNYILTGFEINKSPKRLAAFLGQVISQSDGFTKTVENVNYPAERLTKVFPRFFNADNAKNYDHNPEKTANRIYAGRLGNGPEASGDGWRFRSRRFIFITGRANYEKLSKETGINLVENPDLATDPNVALLLAAIYWHNNKMNTIADSSAPDEFERATRNKFFRSDSAKEYTAKALELLTKRQ